VHFAALTRTISLKSWVILSFILRQSGLGRFDHKRKRKRKGHDVVG
jgi:hypothetical protein